MVLRVALLSVGTVLAVIGLAMLILPGPGILVLAMAGALFASESLRIARALDAIEARARATWRRWRHRQPRNTR